MMAKSSRRGAPFLNAWLFIDRSRTHRRRWCSMQTCGNRHKARRHYQRIKQLNAGS